MVQRLVAALVLTLVLAGCGGTDEERVRSSVAKYAQAIAKGDPHKACGLTVTKDKDACERELTERILKLDDGTRARLAKIKVKSVRVVGRVAEVTLADKSLLGDTLRLRKEGRKWRLDV